MNRCVLPVFLSALISVGSIPIAFAASNEPQLNFKIYSPEPSATPAAGETPATETPATETPSPAVNDAIIPQMENGAGAATAPAAPAETEATTPSAVVPEATSEIKTTNSVETPAAETTQAPTPAETPLRSETPVEAPKADAETTTPTPTAESGSATTTTTATDTSTGTTDTASTEASAGDKVASSKTLQGYIRVVPSGTKIPIIMDTAVDSETSQEGDEFTARTAEDLTIDGGVAVPAGSIIKGRIAQMNAPKHVDRSGSVALKFDTVTTPDNRQIPLVANLVAHGGVVHAKRGLKDVAIDAGTVSLPVLLGLGIGALAGNSKNSTNSTSTTSGSKITKPEAAMIGAGIGLVVGVAILIAKKGKKVDVRPGDEMKIELAEDLRMPMM